MGASRLNASKDQLVDAEPVAANAAGDWKRVYSDLSNVEDVRIKLCEPNAQLRASLRTAFQEIGFHSFEGGKSLHSAKAAIELGEVDLIIWDTSCNGGDVCQKDGFWISVDQSTPQSLAVYKIFFPFLQRNGHLIR